MELDHPGEIVRIEWQFLQLLSSTGAVERAAYYGIRYAPAVVFDGVDEIAGWTPDTDPVYESVWSSHRTAMSLLTVSAEATFAEATRSGSVTVTVTVAPGETIAENSVSRIRCAIYEDDIDRFGSVWHGIGRAIVLDVPLTITQGGERQVATATFPLLDPSPPAGAIPWGAAAGFRAIAFVQRDDDREVLNSARATVGTVASVDPASWAAIKARYR